jgi:hypothetical protein
MRRFIGFWVILFVLSFLLTACGSASAGLVGKWEQVSDEGVSGFGSKKGVVIEFLKDGTADLSLYSSKYTLKDGNRVEICLSSFCSLYDYNLSGTSLTISRSNNPKESYQYTRK